MRIKSKVWRNVLKLIGLIVFLFMVGLLMFTWVRAAV